MPQTTPPTLTLRPVAYSDLPRIARLLAICEATDQLESAVSLAELQRGFDRLPPNTLRGRYLWATRDGQIIGYGGYAIRDLAGARQGYPFLQVHPQYRNGHLEAEILSWCEDEILRLRPDAVLWAGVRADASPYIDLYERQGYQAVRWFHRMQRSLTDPIPAPQLPPGFTARPCQGEADIEPWVEMYNQTFIDHWEFHPYPIENRRFAVQSPTYRADLDWVAIAPDGTFAAFCSGIISADRNQFLGRQQGWIGMLGTRRGYRRQGLGRAMLLLGLQQLQQAGMATAVLGVDGDNPNQAQSLYTSVGFAPIWTTVSYRKG